MDDQEAAIISMAMGNAASPSPSSSSALTARTTGGQGVKVVAARLE